MKQKAYTGFLLLGPFLFLTACTGGGGGSTSAASGRKTLSMSYTNSTVAASALKAKDTVSASDAPLSLFFGSLGVDAFYYRPGAGSVTTVATNPTANNIDSNDWSEWNMLPSGGVATDFMLPGGGNVDIQSLAGDYWYASITDAYATNVGAFGFDFIFLQGMPATVMPDNTVCGFPAVIGYSGPNQLNTEFPGYIFSNPNPTGSQSQYCGPLSMYDGGYVGNYDNILTLVARNDWFPIPTTISYYIDGYDLAPGVSPYLTCWTTDQTLNAFQVEIIDSLMELRSVGNAQFGSAGPWTTGLYNGSGCTAPPGGQLPGSIFISPQATGAAIAQFTATVPVVSPTQSVHGNPVPQSAQTVISSSLKAVVSFNLTPSMITNWSVVSNPANYYGCTVGCDSSLLVGSGSAAVESFVMAPAANGAPWGISVGFTAAGSN